MCECSYMVTRRSRTGKLLQQMNRFKYSFEFWRSQLQDNNLIQQTLQENLSLSREKCLQRNCKFRLLLIFPIFKYLLHIQQPTVAQQYHITNNNYQMKMPITILLWLLTLCVCNSPVLLGGSLDLTSVSPSLRTQTLYNRTFGVWRFSESLSGQTWFRVNAGACIAKGSVEGRQAPGLLLRVIGVESTRLQLEIYHSNRGTINFQSVKVNYYVTDFEEKDIWFEEPCSLANGSFWNGHVLNQRQYPKCKQPSNNVLLFLSGFVLPTDFNTFGKFVDILTLGKNTILLVEIWKVTVNEHKLQDRNINVQYKVNQVEFLESESPQQSLMWGLAWYPDDQYKIKITSVEFKSDSKVQNVSRILSGVCAIKCQACQPTDSTICINCSDPTTRDINTQCLCKNGLYDDGNAVCPACHYSCQLCENTSTSCKSCLSSNHRNFHGTPNQCICDPFYFDEGVALCSQCDSNCATCQVTATNCLNCSGNFTIIAPGTCGCAVGTYVSGTNNCSACNFRCATCSGTSTDCTTCPDTRNNSATGCPCNEGYFEVNNVAACTACDPACTACTSLTNCQNCVSGRVKQGNNCICEDHYYSPTGSICLPCHYSCDSCSAQTNSSCLVCPANSFRTMNSGSCPCDNRYYDAVATVCASCHFSCQLCTNGLITGCSSCPGTRYLDHSSNSCPCLVGYYQANEHLCLDCHYTCLSCSDSTTCTSCSNAYYRQLIGSSCPCIGGYFDDGSSQNCLACHYSCYRCTAAGDTGCSQCDSSNYRTLNIGACTCNPGTYDVTDLRICLNCSEVCVTCTDNSSNCGACQTGLKRESTAPTCACILGYADGSELTPPAVSISPLCYEICGDGLIFDLPCDDSNTVSGDGCSETCQIEPYFTCTNTPSVCVLNVYFTLTQQSIIKDPTTNTAIITYLVSPNVSQLTTVNISEAFKSSLPMSSFDASYNLLTAQMTVKLSYPASVQDATTTLTFDPTIFNLFSGVIPTELVVTFQANNNLAFAYYSDSEYSGAKILGYVFYVMAGLALASFIALLPFNKLISVEIMAVMQASFIGIILVKDVPVMLSAFKNIFFLNGYNYLKSFGSLYNRSLYFLDLSPSFIRNFNIMFLSVGLSVLVGAMMKCRVNTMGGDEEQATQVRRNHRKKLLKVADFILYEVVFTCVLFNLIFATACMVVQGVYGTLQIEEMAYGVVLALSFLAMTVFSIVCFIRAATHDKYGSYSNSFKQDKWATKNFYLFVAVQRMLLGLFIGLTVASNTLSYAVPIIPVLLLILLCVFRPYKDNLHNIRSICNELITAIILSIYAFIGLTSPSVHGSSTTSILAPLEVALLMICIVGNLAVGIYEEYKRRTLKPELREAKKEEQLKVEEAPPVQLMDLDQLILQFEKIKAEEKAKELADQEQEDMSPKGVEQTIRLLQTDSTEKPKLRLKDLEGFKMNTDQAQITLKEMSDIKFVKRNQVIEKRKQNIKLSSQMHLMAAGPQLSTPEPSPLSVVNQKPRYQIKVNNSVFDPGHNNLSQVNQITPQVNVYDPSHNILDTLNHSHKQIEKSFDEGPSILDMPKIKTNINQVYRPDLDIQGMEAPQMNKDNILNTSTYNFNHDVTNRHEMTRREITPEEMPRIAAASNPMNRTELEISMLESGKEKEKPKNLNKSTFTIRTLFSRPLQPIIQVDPNDPESIKQAYDAI